MDNINTLTSEQKAAAVMIAIGADNASNVFKYLNEDEQERLSLQVTRMRHISQEELEGVLNEFYEVVVQAKISNQGGLEYMRSILEKAYGSAVAATMMERIQKNLKSDKFRFLNKVDNKTIHSVLQGEHIQLVALIMSYISADKTGELLKEFPPKLQSQIVERIATTQAVAPEIIAIVEKKLDELLSGAAGTNMAKAGGVEYVADVLNSMDMSMERFIFDELNNEAPDLAEKIRERMFVFEDILSMQESDLQKVIKEVNITDLVFALKGANEELSSYIFANMSERNAETIRSELEYTRNVRVKEVEEAQQRIIAVIRSLEADGQVSTAKGGRNDIIA